MLTPAQNVARFSHDSSSFSVNPLEGKWRASREWVLEFHCSSHLTLKGGEAEAVAMSCNFSRVISGFSVLLQCFVICMKHRGCKS
jgi:hypothetical protein